MDGAALSLQLTGVRCDVADQEAAGSSWELLPASSRHVADPGKDWDIKATRGRFEADEWRSTDVSGPLSDTVDSRSGYWRTEGLAAAKPDEPNAAPDENYGGRGR
jgi:hypothetical protein